MVKPLFLSILKPSYFSNGKPVFICTQPLSNFSTLPSATHLVCWVVEVYCIFSIPSLEKEGGRGFSDSSCVKIVSN